MELITPLLEESSNHLRLVELCFQFSFLSGRAGAGQLNVDRARILTELRRLFEGDAAFGQRQHRRYPVNLPVIVRGVGGEHHAILRNISCSGLLLVGGQPLYPGARLQVRVGRPGDVEYLFKCKVVRAQQGTAACCFTAAPLELMSSLESN